jgi:hypothetical protein
MSFQCRDPYNPVSNPSSSFTLTCKFQLDGCEGGDGTYLNFEMGPSGNPTEYGGIGWAADLNYWKTGKLHRTATDCAVHLQWYGWTDKVT